MIFHYTLKKVISNVTKCYKQAQLVADLETGESIQMYMCVFINSTEIE